MKDYIQGHLIITIFRYVATLREASEFMDWGGAAYTANPYISREWPYLRKRFYTCPFIFPKDSKKLKIKKFKFFRPPP